MGEDLQTLTVIGTPIAWLFALPKNSQSQNGFTITGGQFNYTAEIDFPQSGHNAKITMTFKGLDAFDNLKASINILGSVPKIRKTQRKRKKSVKVSIDDIEETFTRIKPGVMMSVSKRNLEVESQLEPMETEIKQTIEYEPNCLNDFRVARIAGLKSTRNYIGNIHREERSIERESWKFY